MLRISLLGGFQCSYDEEAITERLGGRAQSLLAFLLLHRMTPQPRHYIAFTLWPDSAEAQARTNLRYVVHSLRQAFPAIENYLVLDNQTLHWRAHSSPDAASPHPGTPPAALDVEMLEQALGAARTAGDAENAYRAMTQAMEIYRGDLLPGLYEDWVTVHRETLRSAFLTGLDEVAGHLEQAGEYRRALELRQRHRALEPLDETIYVEIMRLHWRLGDRSAVKRTYDACAAMLQEELDVPPSAAMETALRDYLTHEPPPAVAVDSDSSAGVSTAPLTPAKQTGRANPLLWIAQTKVQPPQMRPDLTHRPRLEEALAHAFRTQELALLSAPAGYGKTTLLATAAYASGLPFAWLSMDEDDDDPQLFLYGLVAALQQLFPSFGAETLSVIAAIDEPGLALRRAASVLVNEILETVTDAFVLILDDLHVITNPVIHQFLTAFFDRLPAGVHVAIGARFVPPLPWARWRMRQRLAEFDAGDLAFQLAETAAWLNEQLRLGLSAQDVTTLHGQTEGWAAGLRLLAGSLVTVPAYAARSALIDRLADGGRHVFDLLAEEVLRRQEPEVQEFLLQTSILPVLTPALCQAITNHPGAGNLLAELYRRNLFLVQLEDRQLRERQDSPPQGDTAPRTSLRMDTAYRYHALFAEFLQGQLHQQAQGEVHALYRRAARAVPDRAISLFIQGGLWPEAADAIEAEGNLLLRQGFASLMARWIDTLPARLRDERPHLLYLRGVCAWMLKDLEHAEILLHQALDGYERLDDRAGQGATLAYLAQRAFFWGDFQRGLDWIARALDYPIDAAVRIQLLLERARIALYQDRFDVVTIDVRAAYGLVQGTRAPEAMQAMLDGYIVGFTALPGGLAELQSLCRLAELIVTPANKMLESLLYGQRLMLNVTLGHMDIASAAGEQALTMGDRFGGLPTWHYRITNLMTLRAYGAMGQREEANRLVERLLHTDRLLAYNDKANLRPITGIFYRFAHSCWRIGRVDILAETHALLASVEHQSAGIFIRLGMLMLDAIWHMHRQRYDEALLALGQAAELEEALPMENVIGSARALMACVYQRLGNQTAALTELGAALDDCAPQGSYGRILIERPEIDDLLRALARTDPHTTAHTVAQVEAAQMLVERIERWGVQPPQPDSCSPLSPREQEVLALLATGAGNQAIADALVISVHTVKRHVAHILQKLNLSSRAEAVAYYHTAPAAHMLAPTETRSNGEQLSNGYDSTPVKMREK